MAGYVLNHWMVYQSQGHFSLLCYILKPESGWSQLDVVNWSIKTDLIRLNWIFVWYMLSRSLDLAAIGFLLKPSRRVCGFDVLIHQRERAREKKRNNKRVGGGCIKSQLRFQLVFAVLSSSLIRRKSWPL